MHNDYFIRYTKNEHGPVFVHGADRYGTLLMERRGHLAQFTLGLLGLKTMDRVFVFPLFFFSPYFYHLKFLM